MKTTTTTEKTTRTDPLEKYFNIPENSTEIVKSVIKTELTVPIKDEEKNHIEPIKELTGLDEYDKKDREIEETYLDVYDKALTAHDLLVDELTNVEGKYMARMHEVMNQTLGTALKAAESMARMKEHKDKLAEKRKGPSKSSVVTTNNTVIMNTVDAIKRLREMDTIDVEVLAAEENNRNN